MIRYLLILLLNIAPTVSITTPTQNQIIVAGTNLTIKAKATDSDGRIIKVAFYNGDKIISTQWSLPYEVTINNIQPGTYIFKARAYDNSGSYRTATVNVTVTQDVSKLLESLQAQINELNRPDTIIYEGAEIILETPTRTRIKIKR